MKLLEILNSLNGEEFELTTPGDDEIEEYLDHNFENFNLSKITRCTELEYYDILNANIIIIKTDLEDFTAINEEEFINDDDIKTVDEILQYYLIEGITIDADPLRTYEFIQLMKGSGMSFNEYNNFLITDDIIRILIFSGPSGCGKTFLEHKMVTDYNLFYKLPQFTTRAIREGECQGSPYVFINEQTFYTLKDSLIGRVGIKSNLFKAKYGSMSDFRNDKINTLILSDEGLSDFLENYSNIPNIKYFILGLDKTTGLPYRPDRDEEMLIEERKVLLKANYVWSYETQKGYMDEIDLLKLLYKNNFLSLNELSRDTLKRAIRLLDKEEITNEKKRALRKTFISK